MASITFNDQNQGDFDSRIQDALDIINQVRSAVQAGESFDPDDVLTDLDAELDGARLDLIALIEDVRDGNVDNSPDED